MLVKSFLLLAVQVGFAQRQVPDYGPIDRFAQGVEASSPSELAQKLTSRYPTALEKTRAIFSWIAQHIDYETPLRHPGLKRSVLTDLSNPGDDDDTSNVLPSLDERVARDVLKKKAALCYGYARLFKHLCDLSGIPCEIINGYARGDFNRVSNNFRTNHSWNAVRLDSTWHLIDVTWASGYFTYGTDAFVRHFDDQYFLTPPAQFALDHFPDDLKWSLLEQPPTIGEFRNSPYKARCFIKYNIISYWPREGVITAAVGDTIRLKIQTDLETGRNIGGGSIEDTVSTYPLAGAVYCKPETTGNSDEVNYTYIVDSAAVQWLQLIYNDDLVLRYRVRITRDSTRNN